MARDIREQAVQYALHELSTENVKPNVDLDAPLPMIEQEMVECVALYRGSEVADEVSRLFIQASLSNS